MPSRHHVGFQQCPFQVHMMIIQGLVDSSQNLKTEDWIQTSAQTLTSACCGKTAYSLGVQEDQIEICFLMKFITGVAALETPLLFEMTRIPLFLFTGFVLANWGTERGVSVFPPNPSSWDWECLHWQFEWKSKSMASTLAFAINSLFDREQLIFVMQLWSTFLVKNLRSVNTNSA